MPIWPLEAFVPGTVVFNTRSSSFARVEENRKKPGEPKTRKRSGTSELLIAVILECSGCRTWWQVDTMAVIQPPKRKDDGDLLATPWQRVHNTKNDLIGVIRPDRKNPQQAMRSEDGIIDVLFRRDGKLVPARWRREDVEIPQDTH